MMTKLDIAKKAVSLTVGFGTTVIVGSIIQRNTHSENLPEKVATPIAGFVIAMLVADVTKRYTDAKCDELINWYRENVNS